MTEEEDKNAHIQNILATADVFGQLLGFEIFKDFIELNFEIVKNVDPDDGRTSWAVVERPASYVEEKLRTDYLAKLEDDVPKIETVPSSALDLLDKK